MSNRALFTGLSWLAFSPHLRAPLRCTAETCRPTSTTFAESSGCACNMTCSLSTWPPRSTCCCTARSRPRTGHKKNCVNKSAREWPIIHYREHSQYHDALSHNALCLQDDFRGSAWCSIAIWHIFQQNPSIFSNKKEIWEGVMRV